MALRNILRASEQIIQQNSINRAISIIPLRSSSFRSSDRFEDIENHPKVEVVKNPPEWKYVERLLGRSTIPTPTLKAEYPSGWRAPDPAKYKDLPYFIQRSRNFMMPVYLKATHMGHRRTSIVKNIEGDIWKMEADLHQLIEKRVGKRIYSQINEMNRTIIFHGDYVTLIQKYLMSKGL